MLISGKYPQEQVARSSLVRNMPWNNNLVHIWTFPSSWFEKDLFEESPPRVEVIGAIEAHNFGVGSMAAFVAQVFYSITTKQLNVRIYDKSGFKMKTEICYISRRIPFLLSSIARNCLDRSKHCARSTLFHREKKTPKMVSVIRLLSGKMAFVLLVEIGSAPSHDWVKTRRKRKVSVNSRLLAAHTQH